jgi:hypothetical protein
MTLGAELQKLTAVPPRPTGFEALLASDVHPKVPRRYDRSVATAGQIATDAPGTRSGR